MPVQPYSSHVANPRWWRGLRARSSQTCRARHDASTLPVRTAARAPPRRGPHAGPQRAGVGVGRSGARPRGGSEHQRTTITQIRDSQSCNHIARLLLIRPSPRLHRSRRSCPHGGGGPACRAHMRPDHGHDKLAPLHVRSSRASSVPSWRAACTRVHVLSAIPAINSGCTRGVPAGGESTCARSSRSHNHLPRCTA
jgi:hypothetical protein